MSTSESSRRPADGSVDRSSSPLTVFVNYRRADTGGYAWALYFRLAERFGQDNVFFDSANLRPGTDWFAEIAAHVERPGVFLALIGELWEASVLERLRAGTQDVVVKELSKALLCAPRVTVIPVLVNGASVPSARPLPLSLKSLGKFQVETLDHTGLGDDIDRLLAHLEALERQHGDGGVAGRM